MPRLPLRPFFALDRVDHFANVCPRTVFTLRTPRRCLRSADALVNSQYFYLDGDGHTVHGPFGLQDMWAMLDRRVVSAATSVCRVGEEGWTPLATHPELLPVEAANPPAPRTNTPEETAPREDPGRMTLIGFLGVALGLVLIAFSLVTFYVHPAGARADVAIIMLMSGLFFVLASYFWARVR